jgi:hypothetical protein
MLTAPANHSTEDDEEAHDFFDAINGTVQLTDSHPASGKPAGRCEHGDDQCTCALCAPTSGTMPGSSEVAHDVTDQRQLSPSPPHHPNRALTPPTASADEVVTLFGHKAAAFGCTLCPYSSHQRADLLRHRRSCHRGVKFRDHFHAGCGCTTVFVARSAATRHALECRGEEPGRPTACDDATTFVRNAARGAGASRLTLAPDEPTA